MARGAELVAATLRPPGCLRECLSSPKERCADATDLAIARRRRECRSSGQCTDSCPAAEGVEMETRSKKRVLVVTNRTQTDGDSAVHVCLARCARAVRAG